MDSEENHKNIVFHGVLYGFQSANLVLAVGALPLDPTLYCDREHAYSATLGPHGGTTPQPHWGRCPLDPQSLRLLVVGSLTN